MVGDPIEVQAVTKAYSKGRTKENVLTIGSVKTNIGHTESVAGIAGIIKTVLALKNELIPRHLNFKTLNPEINLDAIPAQIPLQNLEWKINKTTPRIAGVSSFGITGTDAHVVIQECPDLKENVYFSLHETRPKHIFTISGKTEAGLKSLVEAYLSFFEKDHETKLEDIEYTMHIGRAHLSYRRAIVASNRDQALESLKSDFRQLKISNSANNNICFLFTGQGSQYFGMGTKLYEHSLIFKTNFDYCDSLLKRLYGFSLKPALWDEGTGLLKQSLYSQTSIFCLEYCLLKVWTSWGIKPISVIGHSLGEFAAAVAAGILDFEDALKLVVTRSKLIDALPNASMVAVGSDLKNVEKHIERVFKDKQNLWLDIAAVNTEEQTVLAGQTETVKLFIDYCNSNGVKTHLLQSSHAFHSRLMDSILGKYEKIASKICYKKPSILFISGMEGRVLEKVDAEYWVRHTRDRVRFAEASIKALETGISTFLEVGPHPILSAMVLGNADSANIEKEVTCLGSLRRNKDEWDTLLSTLSTLYTLGFPIDWKGYHRYSRACKMDIPHTIFEKKPHWMTIEDMGSKRFHPLLGHFLPNPSEATIFRNELNTTHVPFLADHALRDKTLFPGAGYLEMALVAGYTATNCGEGAYKNPSNSKPICIQNFSVACPIVLNEKTPMEFQTMVSKPTASKRDIGIYTILKIKEGEFKWICPSTAVYDSSVLCKEPVIPSLDELQATFSKEGDLMDYRGAEEAGYNFGPAFRPLQLQWKAEGNDKEMLFSYSLKENLEQFFVHPCLIDGLFQATAIMTVPPYEINSTASVFLRTINVIVFVEKFTWWGHPCTNEGFIYVSPKGSHLLDLNGRLIATAEGIEYAATTLGNILALIDSQKNPFPPMYDYIWRDEMGPNARRIEQQFLSSQQPIIYKEGEYEDINFYEKSFQLCRFYMMKTLNQLEIDSVFKIQGNVIHWPEIGKALGVHSNQSKLLRYVLMEMATAGYFKILDAPTTFQTSFQLILKFPSLQSINMEIEKISSCFSSDIALGNVDFKCITRMGTLLSDILTGKISTNVETTEIFFTQSHFMNTAMEGVATNWIPFIKDLVGSNSNCVLRILEVGAGYGALVNVFVKHLDPSQRTQLEYTYTDITTDALDKGKELLQNTGIRAKYEIFNIDENPVKQGFILGNYDIILANYAIHWSKELQKSIQNLQQLLRPHGTLLILEGIKPNPVTNMLVGGSPNFWDFEDNELRPYHAGLCIPKWKNILQDNCGFIDFSYVKTCNSIVALMSAKRPEQLIPSVSQQSLGTWIVFGDSETNTLQVLKQLELFSYKHCLLTKSNGISEAEINNNLQQSFNKTNQIVGVIYLWGISPEFTTPHAIAEPYLYLCKYIINFQPSIKLLVLSKGALSIGLSNQSLADPNSSPLIGMTKVLQNECSTLSAKCVDIDSSANVESAIYEAMSTLVQLDNEIISVFRGGRKYVPRLAHHRVKNTSLPIPQGGQKYRLALPSSNLISDLCFESWPEQAATLEQGEYEIEVKAYALNFKDVFVVLKPITYFEQFNTLGYDFAGIVTRVGPSKNYPRFKVGDSDFP